MFCSFRERVKSLGKGLSILRKSDAERRELSPIPAEGRAKHALTIRVARVDVAYHVNPAETAAYEDSASISFSAWALCMCPWMICAVFAVLP